MRDGIWSRFNKLEFQPKLKFSTIQSAPKMELFAKKLAMFAKGSILDVWLGFECACAVCVIIMSLCKFSYKTFFVTFLFVVIQSFHFFNFSDFP